MQCLNCTEDLEVKSFKSRQITSYMYILTLKFGYHLPLDSEVFHHLNKLKFPSYKASLCQVYTDLMALRFCRINLTSRQNIFTISLLHPLRWTFIWTNLNFLHPRMQRGMFGWFVTKRSISYAELSFVTYA